MTYETENLSLRKPRSWNNFNPASSFLMITALFSAN
jgi:hypothetical protein